MKILIPCLSETIDAEEKKRLLSRIQAFRIPYEKKEIQDTENYLYFRQSHFKYPRRDEMLIEIVEKYKNQCLIQKGKYQGPWDIQEISCSESPSISYDPLAETEEKKEEDYRPSREFVLWNTKLQRVHREFSKRTPFPVWLYNIHKVQEEWMLVATELQ
jgi:hypothetical protein